jgi:hypothetical protein
MVIAGNALQHNCFGNMQQMKYRSAAIQIAKRWLTPSVPDSLLGRRKAQTPPETAHSWCCLGIGVYDAQGGGGRVCRDRPQRQHTHTQ